MCRCKDVTLEDIYKAIDEGFTTPEELKRRLRVGMGPCQGRTCMRIIVGILARKTGEKPENDTNIDSGDHAGFVNQLLAAEDRFQT